MPNVVLFAVLMTDILHIGVFICRTHRHTHRQTDRQTGSTNTSQPTPGGEVVKDNYYMLGWRYMFYGGPKPPIHSTLF